MEGRKSSPVKRASHSQPTYRSASTIFIRDARREGTTALAQPTKIATNSGRITVDKLIFTKIANITPWAECAIA